ncbi:MAG: hypothetical protein Q7T27_06560 [Pseudomonas sp.]|uniref:hypothetical protein n=1 Tax=Pseudomonas sp. TaxID=306 RepID=UPI0027244948|nr:hypothetical protein [Pseudomonas sp.]MDO8403141.1 hypothetical protein [Pseudomonas sp.]
MPAFDATLARWFHDHHGIVSSAHLRYLGVSDDEREWLVSTQVLEVLFEGVYRVTSTPLGFLGRCAAVCAADASLALSCYTTGHLLGLRQCSSSALHATTDRVTKPVGRGVVIHRTRFLPSEHIVVRSDGIRHTTSERTYFDLARHVTDLSLASILEQMLRIGLCTYASLVDVTQSLATSGRPGSGRALRVLASRPDGASPADSHDEVRLLRALRSAGMASAVSHPPVRLLNGRVVHPDMGDPRVGFYVEVDHHTWHDPSAAIDYDTDRDRQIRLAGGLVERVTDTQLRADLPKVVSDLLALYRARCLSFGAQTG